MGKKKIPAPVSDEFVQAYLTAALWSSNIYSDDEERNDRPYDDFYGVDDFDDEALTKSINDCNSFIKANRNDLDKASSDYGQHGHDFWLTRNRHGVGFWDRGYGPLGDKLTKASQAYGEVNLYEQDGKVGVD